MAELDIEAKKTLKRNLLIFGIMLSGSFVVFSWVVLMNKYVTRPDKMERATTVNFTVPEPPPPSPPPPEPEPQRQTSRASDANLAPLPDLGGTFSGIGLNLPDFLGAGSVSESLLGDLDNVVMTEDAVDQPPIPQNISVPYPERAKQRDLEGTVIASVQIDENGQVRNIQILESDPPGVFDNAVLEASASWSFVPAKYQGQPVSTWVNIPIPFRLN